MDPDEIPAIDEYPHEDWCHWDTDCCGCTCVSLWDQATWRWV